MLLPVLAAAAFAAVNPTACAAERLPHFSSPPCVPPPPPSPRPSTCFAPKPGRSSGLLWTFKSACHTARAWAEAPPTPPPLCGRPTSCAGGPPATSSCWRGAGKSGRTFRCSFQTAPPTARDGAPRAGAVGEGGEVPVRAVLRTAHGGWDRRAQQGEPGPAETCAVCSPAVRPPPPQRRGGGGRCAAAAAGHSLASGQAARGPQHPGHLQGARPEQVLGGGGGGGGAPPPPPRPWPSRACCTHARTHARARALPVPLWSAPSSRMWRA